MKPTKTITAISRLINGCAKALRTEMELARNHWADLYGRFMFRNPFNPEGVKLVPIPIFTDEYRMRVARDVPGRGVRSWTRYESDNF